MSAQLTEGDFLQTRKTEIKYKHQASNIYLESVYADIPP